MSVETPEYAGMLKRMIRAYGQRERGASWADVGRAFEITRQSAQERFGRNARIVGAGSA